MHGWTCSGELNEGQADFALLVATLQVYTMRGWVRGMSTWHTLAPCRILECVLAAMRFSMRQLMLLAGVRRSHPLWKR